MLGLDRIRAHFTRGMDMINQAATAPPPPPPPPVEAGAAPGPEQPAAAPAPASSAPVPPPVAPLKRQVQLGAATTKVTFKEALEQLAADNDIVFVPSTRQHPGGKQVYNFGSVPVVIDINVVHALDKKTKQWKPMAVDDLLVLAQK